ncbi:MAG: hypothetical protein LJE62_05950 [Silicimonas sp.]|nr:hypothetical protein [Silicimonas sp.]
MTEFIFAIAIFTLAAGGLGLGLMFGRGPARTSCGATDRLARGRCVDCPLRRRAVGSEGS